MLITIIFFSYFSIFFFAFHSEMDFSRNIGSTTFLVFFPTFKYSESQVCSSNYCSSSFCFRVLNGLMGNFFLTCFSTMLSIYFNYSFVSTGISGSVSSSSFLDFLWGVYAFLTTFLLGEICLVS